jgi:hypothetical protein
MSASNPTLSPEEKDPSKRRQQWADASSGASAGDHHQPLSSGSTPRMEPRSGGASPHLSSMYQSFRHASKVFVDSSGELEVPLRRATIIAGEHRAPRRRSSSSGADSSIRGKGSVFGGSLVAYSTAESAVLSAGGDTSGISSFLAACLTVNFISVGFLFVPYGKLQSMHACPSCPFIEIKSEFVTYTNASLPYSICHHGVVLDIRYISSCYASILHYVYVCDGSMRTGRIVGHAS